MLDESELSDKSLFFETQVVTEYGKRSHTIWNIYNSPQCGETIPNSQLRKLVAYNCLKKKAGRQGEISHLYSAVGYSWEGQNIGAVPNYN